MQAQNPWVELPKKAPYILKSDLKVLNRYGTVPEDLGFRLEVPPVPYVGTLDKTKVVLLCLNPGFKEETDLGRMGKVEYEENIKTLTFSSNTPFYYLNPILAGSGGYEWWSKILRSFIAAYGMKTISEKIMCIQYLGYHSIRFRRPPYVLPSQYFSFNLVRKAILNKMPIVIMRSKKLWLESVPELENYPYIELRNYRRPFLTKNNIKNGNFDSLLNALSL